MNDKLTLLIIDDEPELRELLALFIESYIPIKYVEAASGKEAIEFISQQKFDLVISDFNMPHGNGKVVFDYVNQMSEPPKFILITSDDARDHASITSVAGVGYVQKPFEEELLMDCIYKTLGILPRDKSKDEYLPLSISTILKISPFPYELFVKLGDSHFVKYFNANKKITSDDESKLHARKVNEIFVRNSDMSQFLNQMQRTAFESLILPSSGLAHPFELASVHNDLIHMGLKGLIADEELVNISQQNLKTVFAITSKVSVLNDLLSWVNTSEESSNKLHASILTLFCTLIIKNLKNQQIHSKAPLILSYASVLHDLNLSDYYIKNEWRLFQGIKLRSSANRSDQEKLGSHVTEATNLLSKWVHCPTDVLTVIGNHHEWPTGKGFPKNLTGDQVSPLSALFIVAHEAASLVWERKGQEEFLQIMKNMSQEFKSFPHFAEPLEILMSELTKK